MDPKDNSFTSRKFLFCIGGVGIVVVVGLLAGTIMPGVAGVYTELIGGCLGFAGLFITGNVATRYFVSKANPGVSFQGEIAGQDPVKPPVVPAVDPKAKTDPDAPEDDK